MTVLETVRVAAAQATPAILDGAGSVEKAVGLLHRAADDGAQLVVLPETFVPLYPSNAWARGASGFSGFDELWGEVIAGPLYDQEGIVAADCDLRAGLHAKRWFDAVGHYSRADVLAPGASAPAPPAAPAESVSGSRPSPAGEAPNGGG